MFLAPGNRDRSVIVDLFESAPKEMDGPLNPVIIPPVQANGPVELTGSNALLRKMPQRDMTLRFDTWRWSIAVGRSNALVRSMYKHPRQRGLGKDAGQR